MGGPVKKLEEIAPVVEDVGVCIMKGVDAFEGVENNGERVELIDGSTR